MGEASVGRQTWLDPNTQPRSYTVSFGIVHYDWTELSFRFTPASNGNVTLTLRGPWEQSPAGPIYRAEVLWDNCLASNATLLNGSFESINGNEPLNWTRPYGDAIIESGPVVAPDGSRYARLWHDGPLDQTFAVTAGVPVSLRFLARAQVPTNFVDMPRMRTNTPAHVAASRFMRGVNLGNWLDAPPGQDWGAHYDTNDFASIRAEGFDHVRLPIAWQYYTGPPPDYLLSSSIFASADFLVDNALARGLSVIINIHNFDAFATNTYAATNQFYAIWRQIAAHYAGSPAQVAFELDNEPYGFASTAILNPIYAESISQIRVTNPNRTTFVGPSQWNSIQELPNVRLPATDSNLIVTVHSYDPFFFTHQGATWPGPDTATTGIVFPGPPLKPLAPAGGVSSYVTNWIADYNTLPTEGNPSSAAAFQGKLRFAQKWSEYYGRPVHIGEFGAYTMADPASRARFYTEFRATADSLGLGWAMWDWKAGFKYWDDQQLQPAPGLRAAMFPPVALLSTGPGQFSFDSAKAKTFIVQRSGILTPGNWESIKTQTLLQPVFGFLDDKAQSNAAGFYRVLWRK